MAQIYDNDIKTILWYQQSLGTLMAYLITNISGQSLYLGSLHLVVNEQAEVEWLLPPMTNALFNKLITVDDLGSGGSSGVASIGISSPDGFLVWTKNTVPAGSGDAVSFTASVDTPKLAASLKALGTSTELSDVFGASIGSTI